LGLLLDPSLHQLPRNSELELELESVMGVDVEPRKKSRLLALVRQAEPRITNADPCHSPRAIPSEWFAFPFRFVDPIMVSLPHTFHTLFLHSSAILNHARPLLLLLLGPKRS
jgi:hypothetical protein